jgi:hypothetical protein
MAFGVESLDFFTGSELFHTDVVGCMDENNLNYDPAATVNDGDRCGGCKEGYTRLGDPAFTCQEVIGKYIDCKTGEIYWRLKEEFTHSPRLSTYYAIKAYYGSAYPVKTRHLGNDGTPWLRNKNDDRESNQVKWTTKWKEIRDKCGSIDVIPVLPADVPNFLGMPTSTPAPAPASQQIPANVAAQNTSTTLNNTNTINTMSGGIEPVAQAPATTNWPLIIGVAVGAYLLSNQL